MYRWAGSWTPCLLAGPFWPVVSLGSPQRWEQSRDQNEGLAKDITSGSVEDMTEGEVFREAWVGGRKVGKSSALGGRYSEFEARPCAREGRRG